MKYKQEVKLKLNDLINVYINSIGNKGDGICYFYNYIIIVPNGLLKKNYKVKIIKIKDKVVFAKIIKNKN